MKEVYVRQYEQGSNAWREWRRQKIGASDAPIIMGVSPWRTPYDLWCEKVQGKAIQESYAMKRGTELEPKVREWYSAKTGKEFRPVCVESVANSWLIASLDGAILDSNGGVIEAIEIKCPGESAHLEAIGGRVPDHYRWQLIHQMMICGLDQITYISWDGHEENEPVCIKVNYRSEDGDLLFKQLSIFNESIKNCSPPKLTERDEIQVTDQSILSLAEQVSDLQNQIDYMDGMLQEKKKQLIEMLDTQGLTNARAGHLKMSKFETKGTIDYKAIPELKSIDLEKYRKESRFSWRFTLNR